MAPSLLEFGDAASNGQQSTAEIKAGGTYELLPLEEAVVHELPGTDGALSHDGEGGMPMQEREKEKRTTLVALPTL